MSNPDDYVAPEEENLEGSVKAPATGGKKNEGATKAASPTPPAQPSLDEVPDVIGIGRMTNSKGDVATDVMKARIARHFQYLSGELGFKDSDARIQEQITFIDTIGNTLKLEFDKYVVVTDYLLNQIRENKTIFSDGTAFRFVKDLDKQYPIEHIRTYRNYMTLLTMIANSWPRRHELNKLVDVTYAIKDLNRLGKENVTQYFNKLMQV